MPRRRTTEAQVIHEHIESLSATLNEMREGVLDRAWECSERAYRPTVHSFHGIIGGKNNVLVDSVRTQFASAQDFLARWFGGLVSQARASLARRRRSEELGDEFVYDNAALRLAQLMQDPLLREYTELFLERNFYRNLEARTRAKPDEAMWRLWFGDNKMTWGLILAPAHREGEWTNDVSEIRRAKYQYWTVGHIMETGLIDPDSLEPMTFSMPGDLFKFYRSILKRASNSLYEKAVADRYVDYLEASDDLHAEPFLIPELRYAGLDKKHEYRLDYAVLNPRTMTFTGFELSPHSTHGAVTGVKGKTQAALNAELAASWAKEMTKRNKYFQSFGITTVTFTDDDLTDMDACFQRIADFLAERNEPGPVLSEQFDALDALDLGHVSADDDD